MLQTVAVATSCTAGRSDNNKAARTDSNPGVKGRLSSVELSTAVVARCKISAAAC